MRRVVIESPYSGQVKRNVAYARAAMVDCLARGEACIASHLLITQVYNDLDPEQRATGIAAGHAWIPVADALVVYTDYGISSGMSQGIAFAAQQEGVEIEYRKILEDT